MLVGGKRVGDLNFFFIGLLMDVLFIYSVRTYFVNDRNLAQGVRPASVAENPQVIEAYLGHGAAEAMAEGA